MESCALFICHLLTKFHENFRIYGRRHALELFVFFANLFIQLCGLLGYKFLMCWSVHIVPAPGGLKPLQEV